MDHIRWPDGRLVVDRVVDQYMRATRGKPAVPAEYLLPGDTIDLDGLALLVANTRLRPVTVALVFVGFEDFAYVAARESMVPLLGMREEYDFATEATHHRRVSAPSPWLDKALGEGRN